MHTKIFSKSVGALSLLAGFIAALALPLVFILTSPAYAALPNPGPGGGTGPNDASWADGDDIAVNKVIWEEIKTSDIFGSIDNKYNLTPANFRATLTTANDKTLQSSAVPTDANDDGTATGLQSFDIDTSNCKPMILQVNNYKTATTATLQIPKIIVNPDRNPVNGAKVAICSGYDPQLRTLQLGNTWNDATSGGTTNTTAPPSTSGTSGTPADDCPLGQDEGLRWFWCDILGIVNNGVQQLNSWIGLLLYIPVQEIFTPGFESVFDVFRNIGVGLLVIAGLIMVISQAADLEIFAAHTVRKALPRIIIAAIGISLAWPLLKFTVTLFNDLGDWTGKIILSAGGLHGATVGGIIWGGFFTGLIASLFTVGIVASLTVGGVASLLLSALLLLLVAIFVLLLREIIVLICIIIAPLAIAAYVLPGTEKLWKFWRDTLITTLLMYPIIMAFISAGATMAYITASVRGNFLLNILAVMMYFAPYIMLPFAFKLAGGLMSQVISLAQEQHHKSIGSRLAAYRQGEREWLHEQRMGEKTGFGASRAGGWYRRAFTRGGITVTRAGNERYRQYDTKRRGQLAGKAVEEDTAGAGGDDDATAAASQASNFAEAVRIYTTRTGKSDVEAQQALHALEAAYGARMGTTNMQTAAWMARASSVTGYADNDTGLSELANDARRMVRNGYMSASQATMTIKGNKARADQSGVAFGDWLSAIGQQNDLTATDPMIKKMRDGMMEGGAPGALMGGRKETVSVVSKLLADRIQTNAQAYRQAQIGGNQQAIDSAHRELKRSIAQAAGLQDISAQLPPQNVKILADTMMNATVSIGNQSITGQGAIDLYRSDPEFNQFRREYASQSAAAAAQAATQNPTGGGPPGQPPTIWTPGQP